MYQNVYWLQFHWKIPNFTENIRPSESENLADLQEIREMRDHQSRKDRACDLALRLAASLGVDSDSDWAEQNGRPVLGTDCMGNP